jgi:hypothetical protein
MKERTMTFPEVTTGDMALGLYLLVNRCSLVKVEYVTDRYVSEDRLRMTFTGMNIRLQEGSYFAGSAEVDLSQLPCLFEELRKHTIRQTKAAASKDSGAGQGGEK